MREYDRSKMCSCYSSTIEIGAVHRYEHRRTKHHQTKEASHNGIISGKAPKQFWSKTIKKSAWDIFILTLKLQYNQAIVIAFSARIFYQSFCEYSNRLRRSCIAFQFYLTWVIANWCLPFWKILIEKECALKTSIVLEIEQLFSSEDCTDDLVV